MSPAAQGTAPEVAALERRLLSEPVGVEPPPVARGPWARLAGLLASMFVAYHASVLLVYNLPSGGLTRGLHQVFDRRLGMSRYFSVFGLTQGWGMFAPNPHRANIFMRVYVEDSDGEVWDAKLDVYGRRRHPYVLYDRMAKINRRLAESKGYRRPFAAWVCRDWARTHGGVLPRRVWFERLWTRVPPPERVYRFMYYDPMDLHLNRRREESFDCASTVHGQLPPSLRRRWGLPADPDHPFRDVSSRSWWSARSRVERSRGQGAP